MADHHQRQAAPAASASGVAGPRPRAMAVSPGSGSGSPGSPTRTRLLRSYAGHGIGSDGPFARFGERVYVPPDNQVHTLWHVGGGGVRVSLTVRGGGVGYHVVRVWAWVPPGVGEQVTQRRG